MDLISNSDFHQWITRKYGKPSHCVSGFPILYFLRLFRPVIITDQKNLIVYPIQITLPSFVMIQHETLTQVNVKRSSISLNSRQNSSLLTVHSDVFGTSVITYQQMRTMNAIKSIQTQIQRFASKVKHVEGHIDNVDGNVRIHKTQQSMGVFHPMPLTTIVAEPKKIPRLMEQQNEESVFWGQAVGDVQSLTMASQMPGTGNFRTHKAQRVGMLSDLMPQVITFTKLKMIPGPVGHSETSIALPKAQRSMEFSYLMPSVTTSAEPKSISRIAGQNKESVFVEQPGRDIQSLSATSQMPGIDMNRLTDQVYQTLERKIRLEKQRRGYR